MVQIFGCCVHATKFHIRKFSYNYDDRRPNFSSNKNVLSRVLYGDNFTGVCRSCRRSNLRESIVCVYCHSSLRNAKCSHIKVQRKVVNVLNTNIKQVFIFTVFD